jgi:hypothetical protein
MTTSICERDFMRFLFIGWGNDYQRIEIEEISQKENVRHVEIPKIVKKFTRLFKFFSSQFYHNVNSLYLILTAVSSQDTIILQDGSKYRLIAKLLPNRTFVIFRNTVDEKNKSLLCARQCFTFDPVDAEEYSMTLYDQYIPSIDYLRKNQPSISHDVAFVGRKKARQYFLKDLSKLLSKHRVKIDLIDSTFYSYNEYLKRQYSAKVVIEIGKHTQSGSSMRAIEALALERKIITNNRSLKKSLSFAAENIFVIDETACEEDLTNFIESNFSSIPETDIRRLESGYVLKEILSTIKSELSLTQC